MATKKGAAHVLARISAEPWALQESTMQAFVRVASRTPGAGEFQALAASMETQDDDTPWLQVRDGVAIVSVIGPIFRYSSWILEICGGASYARISDAFNQSLADPRVKAIVLDINSPGGQVDGCSELAEMIFAARGRKPIVAYVGGSCCSAAYWLATACDEIVVSRSAMVGSIGVMIVALDASVAMEQAGIKEIAIVSSQSPNKRADLATDDGKALVQQLVDDLADVFVSSVAQYRGIEVDTVLSDFGQGGVLVGQRAVAAGMADGLGAFEDVVQELAAT